MSSEIAIKVQNLSKCYQIYGQPHDRLKQSIYPRFQRLVGKQPKQYFREFWALKDVSFEIKKGEAVGIIGRNGSGKSTLLQMICGTLNPTSGSIQTHGRIAALLELGSGFNPEFTGRENVFMNGAVLGLTSEEVERRFADIEAFADIGEFIDQSTKTYSSGMLVRLAFAVQVCVEPEILIVDEALAVGDALFQKRCFERMEKLRSNGTTLLFVSHDQESVRTLTSRAVFLHHGGVQCIGNSADVLLEYRKLLHEEETRALNESALHLKEKATQARAARERFLVKANIAKPDTAPVDGVSATASGRLDTMSFGDMEAEVLKVKVLNEQGEACSHFDPRDPLRIVVECVAHGDMDHLNVALRIRNKEGVKIYSWGTLNQDMAIRAGLMEGDDFWSKSFAAGQHFSVAFDFTCGLGPNLYEIQAAVTKEGKPYYAEQRMLHWMDEAAFFTVTTDPSAYHFGGVVDLVMTSQLQENDQ
jgi:lipopolysaccharide transport system ATP-binding protein